MIVTCECRTCLLKDLCLNANIEFTDLEGPEYLYITLNCNHKYQDKVFNYFDCSKCKNKAICKTFKDGDIEGNRYLDRWKSKIVTECRKKLNDNAFEVIVCCKGYMPE